MRTLETRTRDGNEMKIETGKIQKHSFPNGSTKVDEVKSGICLRIHRCVVIIIGFPKMTEEEEENVLSSLFTQEDYRVQRFSFGNEDTRHKFLKVKM